MKIANKDNKRYISNIFNTSRIILIFVLISFLINKTYEITMNTNKKNIKNNQIIPHINRVNNLLANVSSNNNTNIKDPKCTRGMFLYNNTCFEVCPKNTISNLSKKVCEELITQSKYKYIYKFCINIIFFVESEMLYTFIKPFSKGSCKNVCNIAISIDMKSEFDCSCLNSCMKEGNCCSDYQQCLNLEKINTDKTIQENCFNSISQCNWCYNKNNSLSCGQCKEGLYLRNGECVTSCEGSDRAIFSNKLCLEKINCDVDNCELCENGNNNNYRCSICQNGYFKYDNQCLKKCPVHMIADRINKVCVDNSMYAYYFIFPSQNSCLNNCGRRYFDKNDCSCDKECIRRGDCCFDIEQYCRQFKYWNN